MNEPQTSHLKRGREAEMMGIAFLEERGLCLIESNYSCKVGEIDMVMCDHNELVFVEVRYRKSRVFGGAIDSITQKKQRKIKLAATHFLQKQYKLNYTYCRFDVLAISGQMPDWHIDWIKNAFQ